MTMMKSDCKSTQSTQTIKRHSDDRKSKNSNVSKFPGPSDSANSATVAPPEEWIQWNGSYYIALTSLTILSFVTRLYKVDQPPWVCWDEVHFGKMASWYINRTFFFDVHPPLGKMSISLVGYLTGYNGTFAWDKPGDFFFEHRYVGMRVYCAILGALLVPLIFDTVYQLSHSVRAATISSGCMLFDTGMITLTRYILLDSPLLFFIMATSWSCVRSWKYETGEEKGIRWWLWSILCGVLLSCAMSVKFVGLFVVLWVGLITVFRLCLLWANDQTSLSHFLIQFSHRAVCLILVPSLCYIAFFAVHLAILSKSGPGDGFYSSAFQSVLEGNPLNNASMPGEVAYGAMVALKNTKGNGAYLHSHVHAYPNQVASDTTGLLRQQVTCYSHKDDNNIWQIRKVDDVGVIAVTNDIQVVKNGDLVKLTHVVTGRNLHVENISAPITRHHYQVSGFGYNSSDSNEVWVVEIENGHPNQELHTMTSHFRLLHNATGCALQSVKKQLPKWAFEQLEVTCDPRPKKATFANQLFHIEWVYFPLLPNITFSSHAPSFFRRFIESHKVMLEGNSQLKAKETEMAVSRPWQWPINLRGQFFSGAEHRVYLLGNPIIWWTNIAVWIAYGLLEVFVAVRRKRKVVVPVEIEYYAEKFLPACRWIFFGWFVHYIPFFAMGRILYYHHYFPAHLFACMLTGLVLEFSIDVVCIFATRTTVLNLARFAVFFTGLLALAYSFYLFYPLAYGMSGPFADDPRSVVHGLRWLKTWEF
ncbi:hypothetical protein RvY_08523 [Ramazzottius varieornatus]|uniref:Protein O-mannosyl-transferase 2 n=1 Tax=Ramazzottius varieornatus TaxID=947166 RepID=A0A1D1V8F1_RAMVA|nr:hypothetical protein RvY_08523 [Ramazzottius varieornatus]